LFHIAKIEINAFIKRRKTELIAKEKKYCNFCCIIENDIFVKK